MTKQEIIAKIKESKNIIIPIGTAITGTIIGGCVGGLTQYNIDKAYYTHQAKITKNANETQKDKLKLLNKEAFIKITAMETLIEELKLIKQEFNNIKKGVSVINVDDYETYGELIDGLKAKYGRLAGAVYTDAAKDIYGNKDETLNNTVDNNIALQKHWMEH